MRYLSVAIFLLLIQFFSPGCKKSDTSVNGNGQVIVQGKITLKIQAKHHWWGVPYLPVYLKKGVDAWPGPDSSLYDLHLTADNNGFCSFEHLLPGNYYVYAHGYDAVFGAVVTGYTPVVLNATTAPGNYKEVILNVSE